MTATMLRRHEWASREGVIVRRLTRVTYGGAYAGALLLGAMIGENMAFTAGVSHGFNQGGKTAARAGLTFGWYTWRLRQGRHLAVSPFSLSGYGRPQKV